MRRKEPNTWMGGRINMKLMAIPKGGKSKGDFEMRSKKRRISADCVRCKERGPG